MYFSRSQIGLFCLCLFLGVSACKKNPFKQWAGTNDDNQTYPEGHVGPRKVVYQKRTPIQYPSMCTKENALSDLGDITLTIRTREKEEPTTLSFAGIPGNPLAYKGLGTMLHSQHVLHTYKDCSVEGNGQFTCNSSEVKTLDPGKPIYICDHNPKPNTLEHEVLTAFLGLYQLKVDFPSDFALSETLFFPLLEDIITPPDGSTPLVTPLLDNAFWSRDGNGIQRITFLPTSRETERQFPIKLWRQPALGAHEGGHGIFSKIGAQLLTAQNSLREAMEEKKDATEFDDTDQGWITFEATAQASAKQVFTRTPTMASVISSFNEGFADIVAAIAMGLHMSYFSGGFEYGNIKRARDPYSKTTDDQKIKALTTSTLKHFFSTAASLPPHPLTPNHQDTHTLGAIFAFTFLDLFREEMEREHVEEGEYIPRAREKAKKWISRLDQAYADYPARNTSDADRVRSGNPEELLEQLLRQMVLVYTPKNRALSDKQCRIIQDHLPAMKEEWKDNVLASCF